MSLNVNNEWIYLFYNKSTEVEHVTKVIEDNHHNHTLDVDKRAEML